MTQLTTHNKQEMSDKAIEQIRHELEQYRQSLFAAREQNLKKKFDLMLLKHEHSLTKPYVFSYNVEWPIESFSKYVYYYYLLSRI